MVPSGSRLADNLGLISAIRFKHGPSTVTKNLTSQYCRT